MYPIQILDASDLFKFIICDEHIVTITRKHPTLSIDSSVGYFNYYPWYPGCERPATNAGIMVVEFHPYERTMLLGEELLDLGNIMSRLMALMNKAKEESQ